MRPRQLGWIRLLGLIACLAPLQAVAAAAELISPRNAGYEIHVALDPAARTLTGSQVLTWRNVQDRTTGELRFHLYWNAWRNDASTWMREARLSGRSDRYGDIREEDWGWIQVDSVRLLGGAGREEMDLTSATRHAWPDDGNENDRTVLVVDLPGPVEPGETIRVKMTWRAKVPRTFARTGYRGDYFFLAHWFPKLGVLETDGWNCHQFHAATEFFSDFGVYDVRMTVPEEFVLGATGRQEGRTDNGDGTVTYRHVQEEVHAFTWTASPDYVVLEQRFEEPGLPPVDMRLLMQPEHLGQAERHFAATRAALKHYGNWFGPYPYGHVTVVDPAYGSGAGGMEYPTLFTCGTSLFNPPGADSPEGVTIHEAGHQFWYGLVGNNEFEHAWLDEGLNTFSTGRTLDAAYGGRVLVRRFLAPPESGRGRRGFLPVRYPGITVDRWVSRLEGYRSSAASDVPATATYEYHPGTAAGISYSKTALWLRTLEKHLGWETLREILSTFFERYRFSHPTPANFFAVANEVAGEDLDWFFDQVFRDSVIFDYAIDSVASVPVATRGFVEEEGELAYLRPGEDPEDAEGPFRTEVVVQRRGDGEFPVEVLLVFEDGHQVREPWDGVDTWTLIAVEHAARLDYAVVDPERVLMLDIDITNNSRLREPASTLPASKWGGKWMIWLQDLLHTMTFFG
jgi:hypothetical protein